MSDFHDYLNLNDAQFRRVDPLAMNLLVARSIPSLSDLDLPKYSLLLDEWASAVAEQLPIVEAAFQKKP